MKTLLLLISHIIVGAIGFAAGIYALPILTAPDAPAEAEVQAIAEQAEFKGEFKRDLQDSDALHWGEGSLAVSKTAISLMGKLAPGPDYKLYLSPEFVETEADFLLNQFSDEYNEEYLLKSALLMDELAERVSATNMSHTINKYAENLREKLDNSDELH